MHWRWAYGNRCSNQHAGMKHHHLKFKWLSAICSKSPVAKEPIAKEHTLLISAMSEQKLVLRFNPLSSRLKILLMIFFLAEVSENLLSQQPISLLPWKLAMKMCYAKQQVAQHHCTEKLRALLTVMLGGEQIEEKWCTVTKEISLEM